MTEDDYQVAVAPLRDFLNSTYAPEFEAYKKAIRDGDEPRMAAVAERLEDVSDEFESLWTASLFSQSSDRSGVLVNEAAGAMAMLSALWGGLAKAHQDHLAGYPEASADEK